MKDIQGLIPLTKAVHSMLNQLGSLVGIEIKFEEIGRTAGICFSSDTGTVVLEEIETITGGYERRCSYPFLVVYRSADTTEKTKFKAAEFLDLAGRWLTGETVELDGRFYSVQVPELEDGRKIKKISTSNFYGLEPNQNGVQDWLLPVVVEYIQWKDEIF